MKIIYWQNDTLLELTGLKDEAADTFVNDATVTARVKTQGGVDVAGQSWPLTLAYLAESDGIYQGVLEAALDVDINDRLNVEVTVAAPGSLEAFFKIPAVVRQRGKSF